MLETKLNNALFKIKNLSIALGRAEKAAKIYREKAHKFATSTSAESLEAERRIKNELVKEVQELKKENKALQEKVDTLILLERMYKNG